MQTNHMCLVYSLALCLGGHEVEINMSLWEIDLIKLT